MQDKKQASKDKDNNKYKQKAPRKPICGAFDTFDILHKYVA